MTEFELLIGLLVAGVVVLAWLLVRDSDVPSDHVPPQLKGGQQISKTPNGPKPAPKTTKKVSKKKTSKKKVTKKVTKKAEPKVEKKPAPNVDRMNKDQLESYAREEFGVELDKRKKKADLVKEVKTLSK